MTKQQKICVGAGGAFGLCVLALGWFLYSAYAERQEIEEGGESTPEGLIAAKEKYSGFFQKKPFPSAESIKAVKENEAAYAKWRADAQSAVEKGSCPPPPSKLDRGDLKIMMSDQVARMQKLPGGNNGRICTPTFQFGFEPYLDAEKKNEKPMPTEREELLELYAQFITITNVVDILHANGVLDIRKIGRIKSQRDDSDARQASKRKKGGKGKGAKASEAAEEPMCYDFDFEYTVRPSAFVKILNELAHSTRYYVVGDFNFGHEGESLKERLNQTKPATGDDRRSGRRRRGSWGNSPEKQDEKSEKDDGLVTRPDKEPPVLVKMKLSVYDFGTGASRADAAGKENN